MSDVPHQQDPFEQIRWRWQIPLLALSLIALALGIWRLRPTAQPPRFEDLYAQAVALKDAQLYPEASKYIQELLADPVPKPSERGKLHVLMAEVIFAHEKMNIVHGTQNVQRIVDHLQKAVERGGVLDARLYELRALAWEWLKRPAEAVADYEQSVAQAPQTPHSWDLRKRVMEIRRAGGELKPDKLLAEYDAFLSGQEVREELRYWAVEQKLERLEEQGQHAEAEQFLAAYAERFKDVSWRKAYDYLRALSWHHIGRLDDAERLLRSIRDELAPGEPLYARSGWLLGKVLQGQESLEPALAAFDEVVNNTTPGAYRAAAILGRGEVLASLERFSESIEAYRQAMELTAGDPYGAVIDLQVVRQSTTALYQSLLTQRKLPEAMGYLRMAARLAPPTDTAMQAQYAERLGDLAAAMGKERMARRDAGAGGDSDWREARRLLAEAGEEYLRLAKLSTFDNDVAAEAAWRAADAFDLAGQRTQTAAVLEGFVHEQPDNTRTPMALLRLGQAYQAGGEYAKAIDRYQQDLVRFPRTPSALAALVPLAECFLALGDTVKAETALLRMLSPAPGDGLTLITPAAGEFRDALFKLAELYTRTGQLDRAIARYEEALERYPEDARAERGAYLLADAYRQSAAQLRAGLDDPRNAAQKEELLASHEKRLKRARALYDQTIERYRGRPEATLSELDRVYVKLSHFYRADAVYDLSRVSPQGDPRIYGEALELYDRAAWLYQADPMAMSAYVQMINCQLRLGSPEKARMALQRARWTLKSIPADAFAKFTPDEDVAYWENYLNWLERTPTFSGS